MIFVGLKRDGNMNLKIAVSVILFYISASACTSKGQVQESISERGDLQTEIAETQGAANNQGSYFLSDTSAGQFYKGLFLSDDLIKTSQIELSKIEIAPLGAQEYYTYSEDNKPLLKVYKAFDPRMRSYSKIVSSIHVLSEMYKDSKGISIGTSVEEFLSKYPATKAYYNKNQNRIVLTDNGHGPRFMVSDSNLDRKDKNINIGQIDVSLIDQSATIEEIRIVRSHYENLDAMENKEMEETQIREDYLNVICGKYYLETGSENYYKIEPLQGEYYISECFEGECERRGKIVNCGEFDKVVNFQLEDISGEMVPTWNLKEVDGKLELHVHDYNAMDDSWDDRIFYRS